MRLAERLSIDVEVILGWPFAKLQMWMLYDEVEYMISKAKTIAKDAPDDVAVEIVREEQERNGWRGVYATQEEQP